MKLSLIFLLLAGSALSERRRTPEALPTDQTPENTSKRALIEGNAGVEKRAPVLPTALPSVTPGIEYAATKEPLSQKIQDEYAGGVAESLRPSVAKISDLLAGQGSAFPAAIHNHLYAPVSAYHNRLANPQTFEVSAPVPSPLAYSEHKISYQPTQFRQNVNQPFQQIVPPEQVIYSHQPQHSRQIYQQQIPQQPRFTYNHVPPVQTPHFNQPIIYSNTQIRNPPQIQTHNFIQQGEPQVLSAPLHQYNNQFYKNTRTYFPQEHPVIIPQGTGVPSVEIVQSLEPGITYAKQEVRPQPTQKEPAVTASPDKVPEKQIVNQHPNQFIQPQGAVSYASFSVGPPAQGNFVPQPTQHGVSVQQQPSGPAHYNPAINFQPLQVGIISPQTFQQPQFRFQAVAPKEEQQFIQNIDPQPIRSLPQSPRLSYFRPGLSLYRNFYTPDSLQTQSLVLQNPSVPSQSLSPIALPPVQFFGKFAHSIFGAQYQQQQPQRQHKLSLQQQPLQQQLPQQLLQQQQPQPQLSPQQPHQLQQLLQQPQQHQEYQHQQQLQQ